MYTIYIPTITSAAFSKNPCLINEKITVSLTVIEQMVSREPEIIYSGEIFAGEVK